MQLSEIWIYPIKSLGGIRLKEAQLTDRGLQHDRRWLIVDENHVGITQRVYIKMALIDVAIEGNFLKIWNREEPTDILTVPIQPETCEKLHVKIWHDTVEALTVTDEADEWFSRQLDKKLRLVFMPEMTQRKVEPNPHVDGEIVSFADAYPFMVISEASLAELNSRLAKPVSMRRFRPNFVISGAQPFQEDKWGNVQIGEVHFEGVKLCSRCVMTTIDPKTAEKGAEPLKTLATYRRVENKVMFGQNLIAHGSGVAKEGDIVTLLS